MVLQEDGSEVQAISRAPEALYPWQLKCCNQTGETRLYRVPDKDSSSLYFAGAAA